MLFRSYNTNFVGDPNNLKTDVISAITAYSKSSEINQFGGRFKYSKTCSIIDNVNGAVTSNITTVRIRRDLVANINKPTQYEFCFDNELYSGKKNYNIKTSGFTVYGIQGTCYFADQPMEGSDIGNLFLFQETSDTDINILSTKFGTVNYMTGEMLIDTVNITSTSLANNTIEVQAIPLSNDVLARRELYLQLDVAKSNFYMKQDSISTGANTSGTRFEVQSSYQNGKKTR